MEKASDDYKGERKVSGSESTDDEPLFPELYSERFYDPQQHEPQPRPAENTISGTSSADDQEDGSPPLNDAQIKGQTKWPLPYDYTDSFNPVTIGIMGSAALIRGKDYHGLNNVDISIGKYFDEKKKAELFIGLGWAPIRQTSDLDKSLNDGILLFNAGLSFKYFTTPLHTFLGQYFLVGLAYNSMFWQYENAITVDDGDEISHDQLGGVEFFGGIGFNLAQTKKIHIGAEVIPSFIFWLPETCQGFDNDVFGYFGILKFRAAFTYLVR